MGSDLAEHWPVDVAVTFPPWGVPIAILVFADECGDQVAVWRVNPRLSPSQTALCGCLPSLHLCLAAQPRPHTADPLPHIWGHKPCSLSTSWRGH